MNESRLIAIDLAKNVFQVCVLKGMGQVESNRRLSRAKLKEYMAQQPPSVLVMEACYSSHYWGRYFESLGHTVKLIPAQHVKPFVLGNKTDRNDALAIAEASQRPRLKCVPIKSLAQQDIQSLHRIRERLVRQRTHLVNQTRGLLSEYGVIAAKGLAHFGGLLAQVDDLPDDLVGPLMKHQLHAIASEYREMNQRLSDVNRQLTQWAEQNPLCGLLMTLPGIGYINATALVSAIGNGSQFRHPREVSIWLGLTPRESSSGENRRLSGITRRGNRYLRKQLVHGARAALFKCKNPDDKVLQWARQLAHRRGANKAAVALASRLARLAWLLMQRNQVYRPI